MTDPLNPDMQFAFGQILSHLAMPLFKVSDAVVLDHSIPKGSLIQDSVQSSYLGHTRRVHYYLPYGYSGEKLPSIYFHDGSFNLSEGMVTRILDKLIAHGKIEPVIAVFDDPVVRGKEYRGDIDYLQYLEKELVPLVNEKYNTVDDADSRAVIGWSRGGMSSFYVSFQLSVFGKCGVLSPAIHPKEISTFIAELENKANKPKHVFMVGATYDYIWYPDAIALKKYFEGAEGTDFQFEYMELEAGHNIPNWRDGIDDILISFFGQINKD